jgi:hypothetical protein
LAHSPKSEEAQKDHIIELAHYLLCLLHHHPTTSYNLSTTPSYIYSIIFYDTPICKNITIRRKRRLFFHQHKENLISVHSILVALMITFYTQHNMRGDPRNFKLYRRGNNWHPHFSYLIFLYFYFILLFNKGTRLNMRKC